MDMSFILHLTHSPDVFPHFPRVWYYVTQSNDMPLIIMRPTTVKKFHHKQKHTLVTYQFTGRTWPSKDKLLALSEEKEDK